MQILMSNEAHQDIDSIFEYISRDSIKYANETSNTIYIHIINLQSLDSQKNQKYDFFFFLLIIYIKKLLKYSSKFF